MNNETDIGIKFTNKIENMGQLKEYKETLKEIQSIGKTAGKTANSVSKSSDKISKSISGAFNTAVLTSFVYGLKNLTKSLSKFSTQSSAYLENINLYQVAFDGNTESADRFINKLTEMYGLDESWLTNTVGIFKQLSNAMNLSVETGTKLSTLLTQMSIDISSLYNIDIDRASSVLQSALAGQTKPIRGATGADITTATLQSTLGNLGIDRYVSDLSYAERRLVTIISLTQQLGQATNDFGKTIESPSNQMRILNEQWARLTRSVGNVFMPLLSRILPYLNGIIMAMTEIINLIAGLFGFKIEDFDYGVSSVADSVLDLEDGLEGASESAKKLKQGLRGFDKLNVITTPTAGTSGAGGGAGGIDASILDAFNDAFGEYNNKLKDVKMKANDIRDSIMEWLGFTKLVNEETGDINWKYVGGNELVENILKIAEKIVPHLKNIFDYGSKIAGGVIKQFLEDLATGPYGKISEAMLTIIEKIFKTIAENEFLINVFTKLFEITLISKFITKIGTLLTKLGTGNGLFGIISKLYSPTYKLFSMMGSLSKEWGGNLTAGIEMWRIQSGMIDASTGKVKGFSGAMQMGKSAVQGFAGALAGLYIYNEALSDMEKNGVNVANTIGSLTGSITSTTSAMMAGASVGGVWGAVIGGAISEIAQGVPLIQNVFDLITGKAFEDALNQKIVKTQEFIDKHNEMINSILSGTETQMVEVEANKVFVEELGKLIDANGKVKDGYEETAKIILTKLNDAYGTNYQLVDGQITLNGIEKQSYEDLAVAIDKVIKQKEIELQTKALEEVIVANKKHQMELYSQEQDELKILQEQMDYYNKAIENGGTYAGKSAKEWDKASTVTKDKILMLRGEQEKNQKKTQEYFNDIKKLSSGNAKEVEETLKKYNKNIQTVGTESEKALDKGKKKADGIKATLDGLSNRNISINLDLNTSAFDNKISNAGSRLDNLISNASKLRANADGGMFVNGKWNPITAYASGGLPPVGQLFMARERGPELVGKIGSHTAVMNNDQIVGSVSNGVYQAVRSAMGTQNQGTQVYNIYLDEEHKLGTYTLEQLQSMAKSNGKRILV